MTSNRFPVLVPFAGTPPRQPKSRLRSRVAQLSTVQTPCVALLSHLLLLLLPPPPPLPPLLLLLREGAWRDNDSLPLVRRSSLA